VKFEALGKTRHWESSILTQFARWGLGDQFAEAAWVLEPGAGNSQCAAASTAFNEAATLGLAQAGSVVFHAVSAVGRDDPA
jgi:hypothetical protein